MVTGLIPTQFATIGLIDEKNPQRIVFSQSRPTVARDTTYGWQVNMNDHAAFRLAYEQQHSIELLPRGVGARQVHELSQQFNVGTFGPVHIEPLTVSNQCIGFLLLVAAPSVSNWSTRDRAIVPDVAAFLSQALANSRRMEMEAPAQEAAPLPTQPVAAERDQERERLIIELAEARRQLAAAENRARQAEVAAAVMQQRQPGQPTTARPQVAQAAVHEVVERAVGAILPLVREKNLVLDLDLTADLPLVAMKEAVLKQLVVSLLENACLVSAPEGEILVRAALNVPNGAKTNAKMVTMSVTDCGLGIRPEDQAHVFDTQYHLQGGKPIAGLSEKANNLAVVQKLAQAGGGDLLLKSEPGNGTTFSLNLPVAEVRPWTIMKPKKEADKSVPAELSSSPVTVPSVSALAEPPSSD
jgi:signal transduction histidine kinase